jgi:hypothetical protein
MLKFCIVESKIFETEIKMQGLERFKKAITQGKENLINSAMAAFRDSDDFFDIAQGIL